LCLRLGLESVVGSAVLPSDLEEFTFPQQGPFLYRCCPGWSRTACDPAKQANWSYFATWIS